jgi:hypothetical protein
MSCKPGGHEWGGQNASEIQSFEHEAMKLIYLLNYEISMHCYEELHTGWSYASTPPYVFMVWCLFQHRNIFAFLSH